MFTGSIPSDTVDHVFDLLAGTVGDRAACWPDGEINVERRGWIQAINTMVLAPAPCFEEIAPPAASPDDPSDIFKRLRIRDGATVDLRGRLPYARDAIASYEIFARKRASGQIPQGTRFQCSIPGAHDVISVSFPDIGSWPVLFRAWQEAVQDEYRHMLEVIPAKDLCIQIDYCTEMVHIGGTAAKIFEWIPDRPRSELFARYTSSEYIAGHLRGLPNEVRIGFHICCGTMPSYPVQQLDDIGLPVDLANAIQAASGGVIDYFHLPAMIDSDEAYFAPLARLDVGRAEIYLGLECNDGLQGMERRMAAARRFLPEFGVAHYCGYFWNEAAMRDLLVTLADGSDRNRLLNQLDAEPVPDGRGNS
jgi:hypothetical protein